MKRISRKKKELLVLHIFNFACLIVFVNACKNMENGNSITSNQKDLPNNSSITDSITSNQKDLPNNSLLTDSSVSKNKEETYLRSDNLNNRDSLDLTIFDNFYDKFHTDTAFQISRITFPLEGFDVNSDNTFLKEEEDNFYWQKKDWVYMHHITNKNEFKIEIKRKEKSIEEKVSLPDSGFYIIRTFSFINEKWYLTFYGFQDL